MEKLGGGVFGEEKEEESLPSRRRKIVGSIPDNAGKTDV